MRDDPAYRTIHSWHITVGTYGVPLHRTGSALVPDWNTTSLRT